MSWIYIDKKTGKAKIHGYDMPPSTVVQRTQSVIVIKVPGHKYWFQNPPGPTFAYAPAEFQVYRLLEEPEDHDYYESIKVEKIIDFPVRDKGGEK